MKMIKKRWKRKIFFAVMIAVVSFFILNLEGAIASQRFQNFQELMEKSLIRTRKVEINGKIFDVFIDQSEKSIIIRGIVEDFEEKDTVEKYFRLRNPADYQLYYDIAMVTSVRLFLK